MHVPGPWRRKVYKNIQMTFVCLLSLFYLRHNLTNGALADLDLSMWTKLTSSSNSQRSFWFSLQSAGTRQELLCPCTTPGVDLTDTEGKRKASVDTEMLGSGGLGSLVKSTQHPRGAHVNYIQLNRGGVGLLQQLSRRQV